jgi:hypothetical protein
LQGSATDEDDSLLWRAIVEKSSREGRALGLDSDDIEFLLDLPQHGGRFINATLCLGGDIEEGDDGVEGIAHEIGEVIVEEITERMLRSQVGARCIVKTRTFDYISQPTVRAQCELVFPWSTEQQVRLVVGCYV